MSSDLKLRLSYIYVMVFSGKWQMQAALHSLGNIAGETRMENTVILNNKAEESLRQLIYETLSKTSKLTPSVSYYLCFVLECFNILFGVIHFSFVSLI